MSTLAELLDAVGQKLSAMDAALAAATERMAAGDLAAAQAGISKAHALLASAGVALASVAAAALNPAGPTMSIVKGGAVQSPDPSNAPPGYATHSPEGFAYFYGIGGDGRPVGEPRLLFGGNTFADAGEIAAWVAAVAQRDANLARWQEEFNTPGSPNWPLYAQDEEDAVLARFDAAAPDEAKQWRRISDVEVRAVYSRLGKTMGPAARQFVAGKINQYN